MGPVRLRKIFSHGNGVYQQRDLPVNLNIGIEKCDLLVCALEWQGLSLRVAPAMPSKQQRAPLPSCWNPCSHISRRRKSNPIAPSGSCHDAS